jgi:hypothetical protein
MPTIDHRSSLSGGEPAPDQPEAWPHMPRWVQGTCAATAVGGVGSAVYFAGSPALAFLIIAGAVVVLAALALVACVLFSPNSAPSQRLERLLAVVLRRQHSR